MVHFENPGDLSTLADTGEELLSDLYLGLHQRVILTLMPSIGTPLQEIGAKAFGKMVEKAAVASGQQWMLTRAPKLEKDNVTSKTNIWRTATVKWARLRVWNKFVTSGVEGFA